MRVVAKKPSISNDFNGAILSATLQILILILTEATVIGSKPLGYADTQDYGPWQASKHGIRLLKQFVLKVQKL